MWLPAWLGEIYSKAYVEFGEELFTFDEAAKLLGVGRNKQSVAFSMLHSRRALLVFERTRPRVYRLLDPVNFVFAASGTIGNLGGIAQERYVKILCDVFRATLRRLDLVSFAVYGSVARGTARENSDIDVLVVSDSFNGSIGSRISSLYEVEKMVSSEYAWLRSHRIRTGTSFYPLRRAEVERLPLIFLDLTEDAVVLYDRDRFLERVLARLKSRLLDLGSRRVHIDERRWYWDLKPDYEPGELVEI